MSEAVSETIPAALHTAARRFGDAEALVEDAARLSFIDLDEAAMRVARALIATGVASGDRVAIWAPNSAQWVVASFGIYSVGAVLVPINTRFKGEEAGHVLRTSGARLLITVTDFLQTDYVALLDGVEGLESVTETIVMWGPGRSDLTAWTDFLHRGDDVNFNAVSHREAAIRPEDTSDLIFTSGTTGAPKGAMLTHSASVLTYEAWCERVGLREGDRFLVVFPFFHTGGLKAGVLACVLQGATIVPQAVFDVPTVIRKVVEEGITVLPGPPTVFQSIVNHPDFDRFNLSTLRLAITGAASIPIEVIRRMRDDLHLEGIVTGYGLTETTGTVSMCRHDDPPEIITTTVGRPLPGMEVRVVDGGGHDLPFGEAGEILVRGYSVMKGYFHDPAATEEAIDAQGWLRTGDIGTVDETGSIRITDRKKDMFIVGGFNAYPAEIEGILLQHPGVAQVAVVGLPDDRLGEVGAAFIIPRVGHSIDEAKVIEWCRSRMANYKVPRRVEAVESLPLNASGKIMKFHLREQAQAGERRR